MGNTFKWVTRGSGLLWSLLGLLVIFGGNGFGFIFLILGLIYIERTTGLGEEWAKKNPTIAFYVFAVITLIPLIITATLLFFLV